MFEIDLPGLKQTLWHKMRGDLQSLVPWFADNDLLLCPTCLRALTFDDFSIEHIIPQQALASDPKAARAAVSKNERSGIILLCRKPLILKGKPIHGLGCNSWKGKFYDAGLKDLLRPDFVVKGQISSVHQVSMFIAGYLGLFARFGYSVTLIPSGLLMRRQFFHPRDFVAEIPLTSKMLLAGSGLKEYSDNLRKYWSQPFNISVERNTAFVAIRSYSLCLPLSRDPNVPIARSLRYVPPRYKLRPDTTTVFD